MRFSDEMRERTDALWQKMFVHPFLRGLSDGTLPLERFKYYIRQDSLYLADYARSRGLAVAKAADARHMGRLAEMLNNLLNGETALHMQLANEMGLSADDLLATPMAPTCHAYTRHLLTVAYSGTQGEILASIFPCAGGYREIGERLMQAGLPDQPIYAQWIRDYASDGFRSIVGWIEDAWNELAERAGQAERERMAEHYIISARYEYMFWDMAWRQEEWPV